MSNPVPESPTRRHTRLAIASSFTPGPLLPLLEAWFAFLGVEMTLQPSPPQPLLAQLRDPRHAVAGGQTDCILVLLRMAEVKEEAARHQLLETLAPLRGAGQADVVVVACPSPDVADGDYQQGLRHLRDGLAALHGARLLDLAEWLETHGVDDVYDEYSQAEADVPYTDEAFAALSALVVRGWLAQAAPRPKVLALDCDGTLWHGTCAEGDPQDLLLTAAHRRLQEMAVALAESGVLVCLCSKNEEPDVLRVFEERQDMPLGRQHLVAWRINWERKADNLAELAAVLGLSLDSFVFIDDNPLECAAVRARHPQVVTLELPGRVRDRLHFLDNLWLLSPGPRTAEDAARTAFYQGLAERASARQSAPDVKSFMASLEVCIECRPMTTSDVDRVVQLTHRTTQFTLGPEPPPFRTVAARLEKGELAGLVAEVSDRFGNYGLVGSALYSIHGDTLEAETLSLSCRALCRGVEHAMVAALGRIAREAGCTGLSLTFRETPRNTPMQRFLGRLTGAPVTAEDTSVTLRLDASVAESVRFDTDEVDPEPAAVAATSAPASAPTFAPHWQTIASELSRPRVLLSRFGQRPAVPDVPPVSAVMAVWQAHLGPCGPHDNFFRLGGNSLLGTRLLGALSRRLGRRVPLSWLFEHPTPAALEARLRETAVGPATPDSAAAQRAPAADGPFPLTDLQQAYHVGRSGMMALGGVGTHNYAETDFVDLDLGRYETAWQRLIDRHDMLRATITPEGQHVILPPGQPWHLAVTDLSACSEADRAQELAAIRERLAHQVLATDRWPVFEIRATRLDGGRTRVHTSFDGITLDLWSHRILQQELWRFYHAPDQPWPAPGYTFREHVLDSARETGETAWQEAEAWWTARIPTLPAPPQLPVLAMPPVPRFCRRQGKLPAVAWTRLKTAAAEASLTGSGLLLAAFSVVLARFSRSPHFSLNVTLFNRPPRHPDIGGVVGDFTSLSVLEVDLRETGPFSRLASRIQRQLWTDLEHNGYSGVRVIRELVRRNPGAGAFMPVVFTSALALPEVPAGGPPQTPVFALTQTPQVWLDHICLEADGELHYNWDAVEAMFPAGLLDDMFASYQRLLAVLASEGLAIEPGRSRRPPPDAGADPSGVFDLTHALTLNRTARAVPAGLLHDGLARQAAVRPDHPAVISVDRTLTYRELHDEAQRLSAWLLGAGCPPRVGVSMAKGWQAVVAVYAILTAGAAYVPLDPDLPAERLQTMVADADIPLVLTARGTRPALPAGVRTVAIDGPLPAGSAGGPAPRPQVTALAYVIYTSGSTGKPKGVMIDHRGALNTIVDINRRFQVGPEDRILAVSSLSFDLSVYDIFGMIEAGGTIVVPAPSRHPDPAAWGDLVARHGVTIWNTVPALMQLLTAEERPLPSLRLVMLSGDWIPLSLPDAVRAVSPQASVISLGGATEASIWSIWHPVGSLWPDWPSVPYGRPLDNQTFWVLDDTLEPRPTWVPGELYIGGIGVAMGYWNDPERTGARFVTHPVTGERLYRTGDLGRYRPEGVLEFLGREDFQVKLRGFRIELGDIEAALAVHPDVAAAVVVAAGQPVDRLVAHVVPAGERRPSPEAIRSWLAQRLPGYMVPAEVVFRAALPLSANGKVDRRALDAEPVRAAPPTPVPQGDGLVQRISALFADILGCDQVPPDGHFFTLGGHSLLALRLVRAMEGALGARVELIAVFQNPTPQALASHLRNGGWSSPLERVLVLQPRGSRPPFFWTHGLNGSLFYDVVNHIGPDQPFYGLLPRGLDGSPAAARPLSEMAAESVAAMRMVQPHGPYHLGGYCFGATLALEMAQQLVAAGERVDLLALVELPTTDMRPHPGLPLRVRVINVASRVAALLTLGVTTPPSSARLRRKLRLYHEWVRSRLGVQTAPTDDSLVESYLADVDGERGWTQAQREVARVNTRASMAYVPQPYPGHVTLIRREGPLNPMAPDDPAWGWQHLARGGVTVHRIPGAHHSHIIHGESARAVAACLERCMVLAVERRRAQAAHVEQPLPGMAPSPAMT